LPGQPITVDDVHNMTSITYPAAYRNKMSGQMLKDVLEDVADNLFNEDPYYQQGGDMVRVGGMGYAINPNKPFGQRITNMQLLSTGSPIEASKDYTVAGWASVNEGTEGPAIWDVVCDYLRAKKSVNVQPRDQVKLVGT
jgi:sulfur-oxidizing protein SoxB